LKIGRASVLMRLLQVIISEISFDPHCFDMSLIKSLLFCGCIVVGQIATPANAANALRFGPTQAFASPVSSGRQIAVDRQSNSYVLGLFGNEIDFGITNLATARGFDVFLAKLQPSRSVSWAMNLGSTNYGHPGAIAIDVQGNVCVVVSLDTDVASAARLSISKRDTSGTLIWQIESTAGEAYAASMAVDRKGNCLVAGWFRSSLQIGGTNLIAPALDETFFLLKLNPNGGLLWARQAIAPYPVSFSPASGVSVDARGNVYVVGQYSNILDFGDGVSLTNQRPQDVYTAKFSSDGKPLWATPGGGQGLDNARGIATSALGFTYVAGSVLQGWKTGADGGSYIGPASFVAKYGPRGKLRWVRLATGPSPHRAFGLAMDRQGNTYVSGEHPGGGHFGHIKVAPVPWGSQMFIWSLDRFGHSRYVAQAGSNGGFINAISLAARATDDVVFTGQYLGNVAIGKTNLFAIQGSQIFVSRLRSRSF